MKISAKLATIFCAIFAVVCLGVSLTGFSSLGDIADPAQLNDAKGYAWFWMFLAGIAIVFGVLSWFIARNPDNE